MISHATHQAGRPAHRRAGALLAAVALAALALLGLPSPAFAHDELLSTDPAAGATLDAAPSALTLTFSGNLLAQDGATEVQVTDGSGASVTDGPPVVSDNVLTQPLTPGATGSVTVLWRVVSSDGHPISGEYAFSVIAAPAPTPSDSPSATPTATPSATASTTTAEPTAGPSETSSPASDDTGTTPWIVVGVVVLALGGAVLAYLLARTRRGASSPGAKTPSAGSGDTSTDR